LEKPIETDFRFWTDPNNWPGGVLPVEGDDVHIEPGWKMVLDIPETPIFEQLRINGELHFDNDTEIHLQAKKISVRAGELIIGYGPDLPHQPKAKITLYGNKSVSTSKLL